MFVGASICFMILIYCNKIECLNNCNHLIISQLTEPVDHAECPTWDTRTNILVYVDIHSGRIFTVDVNSGKQHSIKLNGDVAAIVPDKKRDKFLVGLNRSLVAIEWDGKEQLKNQTVLATVQKNNSKSRFNEGKADSKGRLWIGSMGNEISGVLQRHNEGRLFRVTRNTIHKPTPILTANISNGCAWNSDNTIFFYIDTPSYQVVQFDFDEEKGEISNKKVVLDFRQQGIEGMPDGMTIDREDNLWIAANGGGAVIKINPSTGEVLQQVNIPAEQVTSVAWGGYHLNILFVTTSRFTLNQQQRKQQPKAGSVFSIKNLGTGGWAAYECDLL